MKDNETILYKQLFIFSSIIFLTLALSYVINIYKDDLKLLTQSAAAAAQDSGRAFGSLMTEELDPDFK